MTTIEGIEKWAKEWSAMWEMQCRRAVQFIRASGLEDIATADHEEDGSLALHWGKVCGAVDTDGTFYLFPVGDFQWDPDNEPLPDDVQAVFQEIKKGERGDRG